MAGLRRDHWDQPGSLQEIAASMIEEGCIPWALATNGSNLYNKIASFGKHGGNMSKQIRLYSAKWTALCLLLAACGDQTTIPSNGSRRDAAVIAAITAIHDQIPQGTIAADFRSVSETDRAEHVAASLGFAQRDRDEIVRCPNGCVLEGAKGFVSVEQMSFNDETATFVIVVTAQYDGPRGPHVDETGYRVDLRLVDGAWKAVGKPQIEYHHKLSWS